MLANEAGSLLARLAKGGEIEIGPADTALLGQLVAQGLVAKAPNVSAERAALEAAQRELAELAKSSTSKADRAPRERLLRSRILDLVERVGRAHGACLVRSLEAGPYRANAARREESYIVTFEGRALLSDLAPRLDRVGPVTLTEFRDHMKTLREVLAFRCRRAQTLATLMRPNAPAGSSEAALRSAAVGLASRREPEERIADRWTAVVGALARADAADGGVGWTPDQEIAAAEGILLSARDLSALGETEAKSFHRLRAELASRFTQGHAEDALDAAVLVGDDRGALDRAADLARTSLALGLPLTLSAALVLDRSPAQDRVALAASLHRALSPWASGETELVRTMAAVLLALAAKEPNRIIERTRELHAYLTRFGREGMLLPSALLGLLEAEPAEILDLVRLASSALEQHALGAGGAESMVLAVKLLLSTALLARGDEGDPEEQTIALRFDEVAVERLGAAGLSTHVPLTFRVLSTFHRPALDAAAIWRERQPTHSPSVFGSSRSTAFGRSFGRG